MSRRPTTHELEALIAAHAAELAALKAENEKLAQRVLHLEEQLRLERLRRYAPKSEKLKERIFNEAEQAAAESRDDDDVEAVAVPDTGLPEAPKPAPKTRGRKPLPDDLPRQRVEHDLGEDQKDCPCCRNRMHRMGETVTEQLHVEVKASVLQHVRFKYACRHCERTALNTPIVTAPMPAQPLPGSVATPSTLALVLANKYVDGTPLYRVADALGRADVSISRGTLGNWVIRASELHLHRVYDALQQKLRSQPLVHGDETWVQVLKEDGRDAQAKSFMWAYRSGQDCAQPVVLFDYQPGRGQEHPQAFLAKAIVCDNLKAGVVKALWFEPTLNQTFAAMAEHYDTTILPTRSRKPRDKGKVEGAVLIVERWILARLRHRRFFNLTDLHSAIADLLEELNSRPMRHVGKSRRQLFEEIERTALAPLPSEPFEYAEWKTAKVHPDYHVEVDKTFYSVPHRLIGRQVDVRLTYRAVEIRITRVSPAMCAAPSAAVM
ncbi:transposase [Bradyrhizobium diazoefficiens]